MVEPDCYTEDENIVCASGIHYYHNWLQAWCYNQQQFGCFQMNFNDQGKLITFRCHTRNVNRLASTLMKLFFDIDF